MKVFVTIATKNWRGQMPHRNPKFHRPCHELEILMTYFQRNLKKSSDTHKFVMGPCRKVKFGICVRCLLNISAVK